MAASTPTALVTAAPTLFRQGLLALFRERWPQLLLTLTADASQVAALVTHRPFGLLVLDGALPGLALPGLLAWLHRIRPTQRLLVLADPRRPALRGEPLAWPNTQMLVPNQVPPGALAALSPWLDATHGGGRFGPVHRRQL